MKENLISLLIILGVLGLVGILWFAYENPTLNPKLKEESYVIIRKWDMPHELSEISGIQYISKNIISCIQDEEGIIFMYNLSTDTVEQKINFSKAGDYEGIAIVDSTAFVLESNGKINVVENYLSPDFKTRIVNTFFSSKNDMESLTLDSLNNRLLMVVKEKDPNSKDYKGIYSFNLETYTVDKEPVHKILVDDPIFFKDNFYATKGKKREFLPSDIAINPLDNNIYILEGKNPRLLIMDPNGKLLKLHVLNKKSFNQPEGITFSPEGKLYISNEGKGGKANILEVELKEE